MKKNHTSVAQMVRETTDPSFAKSFEDRLHSRRIVKDLVVLRAGRNLSQAAVAEKMGCSQSRISKLEASEDSELTLGDLARYADAIGFRLGIVLEPRKTTSVGRVKKLAFQIKDELDRLAGLARGDEKIARGVVEFFNEAFFNLVRMLQDSAKQVPCDSKDGECLISFEIIGGEPTPLEARLAEPEASEMRPARRRGRRPKAAV